MKKLPFNLCIVFLALIIFVKTTFSSPTPTPTVTIIPIPTVTGSAIGDCFGCDLSGYVTDVTTGKSIKNVAILIYDVKVAITNAEGYYDYLEYSDYYDSFCVSLEVKAYADGYQQSTKFSYPEDSSCSTTLNFELRPISKNSIYGYILDKYKYYIPIESAKIILKGVKSKYKEKAVSDAEGYFEFTNIKKGKYFIYVSKKGYKKRKKKVELKEGETIGIEVILKDK